MLNSSKVHTCFPPLPLFLRDKKLTLSFLFEFLFWQLPLFCFVFLNDRRKDRRKCLYNPKPKE